MSQGPGSKQDPIHSMGTALVGLGEAKIVKIVAMVDALPARGEADALIAPLRPRLAELQVSRPLRFARLLFVPLDPVLVPASEWRRNSPGVPRAALQPLATLVKAALGDEVQAVDARLAACPDWDGSLPRSEGRALWPRAASILRGAAMPESWKATGLATSDFTQLSKAICLVLEHAPWAQDDTVPNAGLSQKSEDMAARLADLLQSAPGMSAAVSCLLTTMLATLSGASARIDAIEAKLDPILQPPLRRCRAAALEFLIVRLEAGGSLTGSLWKAARQVQRDAAMLDDMLHEARRDPTLVARIQDMRRNMDERCRARFEVAIQSELVDPAPSAGKTEALTDEAMGSLEAKARNLRMFAHSAGRIGSRPYYERGLANVAQRIARGSGGSLSRMDRARLVEMLQGSAAAWAHLKRGH